MIKLFWVTRLDTQYHGVRSGNTCTSARKPTIHGAGIGGNTTEAVVPIDVGRQWRILDAVRPLGTSFPAGSSVTLSRARRAVDTAFTGAIPGPGHAIRVAVRGVVERKPRFMRYALPNELHPELLLICAP